MIIKFKTQFYNQIINKQKTQTIRYWKSCKLKNNDKQKKKMESRIRRRQKARKTI